MPLPTLLTQHIARRPQRIALLQHVAEQGSITRAAKAAGISYKAAWDAIDELNNLAASPLVERSTGGRGGGGAKLSNEGQRVLDLYLRLQALQAQVLQAEQASDLDLLGRLMLRTSARNQLSGTVSLLQREGRHDRIGLTLAGGAQITALITPDSTERLDLALGDTVVALLKAGWVRLSLGDEALDPDDNCLQAQVSECLAGDDGQSEVRLQLGNGQSLCAIADSAWLQRHGIGPGSAIEALFHPSYVLIGTPL